MPETIRPPVSKSDIDIFRSWLEKQPHLPQDVDDAYITHFIDHGKGSIERAKKTFDNYYKVGQCFPEMFGDNNDPFSDQNKQLNNELALCFLPDLSPAGNKIIVSRFLTDSDAAHFDFINYFARHCRNTQLLLWESDTPYNGVEYILDCEGANIGHLRTANPAVLERAVNILQNANPIRVKAMHVIGLTPILEKAVNLFMSFMKEKLRERVTFHSSLESLQKLLPPNVLPKEYGGDAGTIQELHDRHQERLQTYRQRYISDMMNVTKLASHRPKSQDEVMTGTFRKLQLD